MTYLEKNQPLLLVLEEEENTCWEYKTAVLSLIGQQLAMCLGVSSVSMILRICKFYFFQLC